MWWKVGKVPRRATRCATETRATIMLGFKDHKIMEFQFTLVFYAVQLYWIKKVKIDFSHNQIGEIEKKMTFQDVFMYK